MLEKLSLLLATVAVADGLTMLKHTTTYSPAQPTLNPHSRPRAPHPTLDTSKEGLFGQNAREEGVRPGLVNEVPFEVRFSIGNLVTVSGAVLLVYCLASYLLSNGRADLVQTLGFVYAIPALVGGLALKYAELPPVPCDTSPQAEALRETKSTKVLRKIHSDATRFTYGDAHMEEPLKALKLAPRGMGPPTLLSLRETVTPSGGYALSMAFKAENTPYRVWKDRAPRYATFFGPNVRAELRVLSAQDRTVELTLATLEEGEDTTPKEMVNGELRPIKTAAEEEAAAAAA